MATEEHIAREAQLVSAWMDGELEEFEQRRALQLTTGSRLLQQQWQQHHLIRDVLQHHHFRQIAPDLAIRVSQQLDQEAQSNNITVPKLPTYWRQQIGRWAMVASVAVVALLLLSLRQPAEQGQLITTAENQAVERRAGDSAAMRTMAPYLVNHATYSGGIRAPYVTLVGHGQHGE
ncbi:MAG: hypothetical protein HQL49_13460 [Gammaproteobacteria bacterium]|nr:hypothetical protein [Gammaproteobacteria bacterium]